VAATLHAAFRVKTGYEEMNSCRINWREATVQYNKYLLERRNSVHRLPHSSVRKHKLPN